jgi:hypothetical protein
LLSAKLSDLRAECAQHCLEAPLYLHEAIREAYRYAEHLASVGFPANALPGPQSL